MAAQRQVLVAQSPGLETERVEDPLTVIGAIGAAPVDHARREAQPVRQPGDAIFRIERRPAGPAVRPRLCCLTTVDVLLVQHDVSRLEVGAVRVVPPGAGAGRVRAGPGQVVVERPAVREAPVQLNLNPLERVLGGIRHFQGLPVQLGGTLGGIVALRGPGRGPRVVERDQDVQEVVVVLRHADVSALVVELVVGEHHVLQLPLDVLDVQGPVRTELPLEAEDALLLVVRLHVVVQNAGLDRVPHETRRRQLPGQVVAGQRRADRS